jgi:predicted nucleotidyltransferase
MNKLIKENIERLKEICKNNRVKELSIFGSALGDHFNVDSDIDFVVIFDENLSPIEFGDAYFSLLEDLENLYQRKVDLISYRVVRNPVFLKEIDETKVKLYAA